LVIRNAERRRAIEQDKIENVVGPEGLEHVLSAGLLTGQESNLLTYFPRMTMALISPSNQIAQSAPSPRGTPRDYVWAAALIASGVPEIVCHQFGIPRGMWLSLGELFVILGLAVLAAKLHPVKNLVGFILAVAAFKFGWDVAVPLIEASSFYQSITSSLDWSRRFFLARAIRLIGALLLIMTLIGSGIGRRELFLMVGNWRAPVQPEPFLRFRRRVLWIRFAVALLLIFGVVLPMFLYFILHPDLRHAHRLLPLLPLAIATSAMNAANEEFQFRSVLLARLENIVSRREAVVLTAVVFGVGHFFGQPSGWGGALMAGIAGWFWAKSMVETRGFACAFASHFVQDMVIFGFLALSGAAAV
jgi:membrane protease YdiL (CAAX protease family)